MKVLLTGASGFVGAHVLEKLLDEQHDVVALDRSPAPREAIAHGNRSVSRISMDLEDIGRTRTFLDELRPDAIVHLAWYADPRDYLTSKANLASASATIAMVDAALSAGCRKLVMTGSCVEYASKNDLLKEEDAIDPRSLYASCKHATWLVSQALARAAGAQLSWARVFHLHGPGEHERRLIPWVARELKAGNVVELTDGSQVRDHLHVADVAAGLVAMLSDNASGVYNVCSGEPVTLRHVLETVADIVGRSDLLHFGARAHRPDEIMFLAGNSSRLRSIGWSPRFGLRDGLMDALADL